MSAERYKILQEIDLIPDEKLPELYALLHNYRVGVQAVQSASASIMKFAGCWRDLPPELLDSFVQDVYERRRNAFSRRSIVKTEKP